MQQSPSCVLMVRPHHFHPNPQTMLDNHFQQHTNMSAQALSLTAFEQVTSVANTLKQHGVQVLLFDDTSSKTPDSVFPNNWFCTDRKGYISIFPMYCQNRRLEVRSDILETLQHRFHVQAIHDFRHYAQQQKFLEGTGAMVIDHQQKLVYVARSQRVHEDVLADFCQHYNYRSIIFDAVDNKGSAIYHTNVMMSVCTDFVIICLDCIKSTEQREQVVNAIQSSGKQLIGINEAQMNAFAGNVFELENTAKQKLLAISETALAVLTNAQIQKIQTYCQLIPVKVSALELAGGSIRCMLAGIHLTPKIKES